MNKILSGGSVNKNKATQYMEKIAFSIVILIRNEEKLIGNLLERLKTLTKDYNTETLIIDSESTDNSSFVIMQYQNIINNLRSVRIRLSDFNFGRSRNSAVNLCRGKYVFFISADAIPYSGRVFDYFLSDFQIDKKVVAVFGKQTPYKNHRFIHRSEVICRFKTLSHYVDKTGILVQDLKQPFIKYAQENKFIWFFMSNVFCCYRRSFLLKHPFALTNGFEDIIMGKEIIENGFIKIYDSRCVIVHSHNYSFSKYYEKQKRDYLMRFYKTNIRGGTRLLCKLNEIKDAQVSLLQKLFYLIELCLYYLVKIIAVIKIKISYF